MSVSSSSSSATSSSPVSSSHATQVIELKPAQAPLSPSAAGLIDGLSKCGERYRKARVTSLSHLATHGLPGSNHELWRFTAPSMLKLENAAQVRSAVTSVVAEQVAGSLQEGVEVLRGDQAFELLERHALLHPDTAEAATLTDLCEATTTDLCVVRVGANCELKQPLRLSAVAQQEGCGSRFIAVLVGANSSATIIEDLTGDTKAGKGLELERCEIIADRGAHVRFVHLQQFGDEVRFYGRHRVRAAADAKVTCLHVALGARVARIDLDLMLPESGADVTLLGISVVDGRRHMDFHPNQRHEAPHCRSDLFLKSVVKDKGRSVYYGYIKVAEGAQRTDAYQTNRNLLLSNDARADSIPNLEIKANDVKCSHGASVTHVGEEDMFYLKARGLSPLVAERLLVEGFLVDVLERYPNDEIRQLVTELIAARLDRSRP